MATVDEVRLEQTLLHVDLAALGLGEMQEFVSLNGVRLVDVVEVVVESDVGGNAGDVGQHLLDLVHWHTLALAEVVNGVSIKVERSIG